MNRKDKEAILAKNREGQEDEGYVDAFNKGLELGGLCVIAAALIIITVNLIKGRPIYGALAVICAYETGVMYPRYKFTKYTSYLIASVIVASLTVIALAAYILKIW